MTWSSFGKRPLERLRLVGDLELEERLRLDELARSIRILLAGNVHDNAVVALLLDDRLGDAESFDARTNGFQRAVDSLDLFVLRNRLLRVVDLEREIRPALEIQPALQRNVTHGHVMKQSVRPTLARRDVAREQEENRDQTQADDGQYAILQGHTTAGRR